MKILSATVFLSLGMAIGSAISAVAGSSAAGVDKTAAVEVQPLIAAEVDHVQAIDGTAAEAGIH